ncbi:MAG: ribosome small subunit-dependent GTPase A [Lentimicrobium sp.]
MKLGDFGYYHYVEKFNPGNQSDGLEMGRVIAEHKERYIVITSRGEFESEITGNMRFTAKSRTDFPAVGDWVELTAYESGSAIIHRIFPRFSTISRQATGQAGETQIIAANVDCAFLIQAIDRDFNINRLERYLTICYTARVKPVIILSKTDLMDELQIQEFEQRIKARIKNVPIIAISNETKNGYDEINEFIAKGKTYCMLGSSGVGKSTLLNNLSGKDVMKTGSVSRSTNKGRHVTSHRELILLENGGILIDNPGMREVGLANSTNGLEITFDLIAGLSRNCKFKDCTHTNEVGCYILEQVEKGEIDKTSYENYLKLGKEAEHFESTVAERRRKEKVFGKIMKNYKKDVNKNTFLE